MDSNFKIPDTKLPIFPWAMGKISTQNNGSIVQQNSICKQIIQFKHCSQFGVNPPFHLRGVQPKVTGYLFGDRILIDNDLSIIGSWT